MKHLFITTTLSIALSATLITSTGNTQATEPAVTPLPLSGPEPQHDDPISPGWSAWVSVGGNMQGDPASCSRSGFRTEMFSRGADNALWYRRWTGTTWTGWTSLGGALSSSPAAVCRGNIIDVFVRGPAAALWTRRFNGTSWGPWQSLGGGLSSGPGASSSTFDRKIVFVKGLDNSIWFRSYKQ